MHFIYFPIKHLINFLSVIQLRSSFMHFDGEVIAFLHSFGGEIDDFVFGRLKQLEIRPAPPCTDEVFVRRVYVDLLGTVPTANEAAAFLADPCIAGAPRLQAQAHRQPARTVCPARPSRTPGCLLGAFCHHRLRLAALLRAHPEGGRIGLEGVAAPHRRG